MAVRLPAEGPAGPVRLPAVHLFALPSKFHLIQVHRFPRPIDDVNSSGQPPLRLVSLVTKGPNGH